MEDFLETTMLLAHILFANLHSIFFKPSEEMYVSEFGINYFMSNMRDSTSDGHLPGWRFD